MLSLLLAATLLADPPKPLALPTYAIEPPDVVRVEVSGLPKGMTAPAGDFLVRPDGTVALGAFGDLSVTGLTPDEAAAAATRLVGVDLSEPAKRSLKAAVKVIAYNSKFYYVVTDAGRGEQVQRCPCTGNETVLDAVTAYGLTKGTPANVWVARRGPNAAGEQVLPVDFRGLTEQGSTATNYQLLPGDRVFVKQPTAAKETAFFSVVGGSDETKKVAGQYPLAAGMTVLDALKATKVEQDAVKTVRVCRAAAGGRTDSLAVDWAGITQLGQAATNYVLKPGDTVVVNEVPAVPVPAKGTATYYVIRRDNNSQKASQFSTSGSVTVVGAITSSGLPLNSVESVSIFRPAAGGKLPELWAVDWDGIARVGRPEANTTLKPGDCLLVTAPQPTADGKQPPSLGGMGWGFGQ